MKVWMLANGVYDGYRVVGIFSTKQGAEHARGVRRDLLDHDPEEFELDDPTLLVDPEPGLEVGPVHRVRIDLDDGRVVYVGYVDGWYRDPVRCRIEQHEMASGTQVDVFSPISEEHAAEAAVAVRLAWLWEKGRIKIELREDGRADQTATVT